MAALVRALWAVAVAILWFEGVCLAWIAGGFWWILGNVVITPIGVIHGFGHFAGFW